VKLAQRVRILAESATLAVSAKAARMKSEGIDVISFGAGEPDFDTPEPIKQAAVTALLDGQTKYGKPASGLPAAKRAVCEKLARENRLRYTPNQVIITSGGKMAINLAMQALIDPGDEVVIPAPYWVSYPEIAKLVGGVPIVVMGTEERDYKLTPGELHRVLTPRTKMFVHTSPSNPSGVTYSPDETRALGEVLQEHDLFVLSDEIYDRLVFDGQAFESYAAIGERAFAQTITINALSKSYAMTGWRLGYAAGPAEVINAMAKLQSQFTSGTVTFNQYALIEALTGDQQPVEAMRREFQRRAYFMHQRLAALPGVRCPKPTGAFYCFPNVSGTYARLGVSGSIEFSDLLLEEARVAVVPGIAFGMDGHVRMSFAAGMEELRAGLDRIEKWLAR